jgi:hypothetical protein
MIMLQTHLVAVSANDVPARAAKWATILGLQEFGMVLMDAEPQDGGRFIYDPSTGLPAVVFLGDRPKVYLLAFPQPLPGRDGSDLALYDEILADARAGNDKDAETCAVIVGIQEKLVGVLQTQPEPVGGYRAVLADPYCLDLHRQVLTAKFTACTIWREGRLK